MSTETILHLITIGYGVQAIYTSLELLRVRTQYETDGLLSWYVVNVHTKQALPSFVSSLAPVLQRFQTVLVTRIVVCASLIVAGAVGIADVGFGRWLALGLALAVMIDLLIFVRHPIGLSGSFDISLVTGAGLLVAALFVHNSIVQRAAIAFIAAQTILAYLLAGLAKATSPEWRNGEAIEQIFRTKTWGHASIHSIVNRFPRTKFGLAWTVIGFEVLFVLVLFVQPSLLLGILATAVVFHLSVAVFMGINSFVFSFTATYPAIYATNQFVPITLL